MVEGQKDGLLNALRESAALKIAGFLGVSVLTACGTNSAEYTTPEKPTPVSSTTEAPTKVGRVSTPKIDQSATGLASTKQAVKILTKEKPVDLQDTSADFIALIDAVNGKSTELNKFGITVEDVAINYEVNKLLLKKLTPSIDDLRIEEVSWRRGAPDRLSIPAMIDDTRAVNFLLGELLLKYQQGEIELPSMQYNCPKPDDNSFYLSDGTESSYLLPPLGVFRYSGLRDKCSNLGEGTESYIELYESLYSVGATLADSEGLPATSKAFAFITTLSSATDPDVNAIITKYLGK